MGLYLRPTALADALGALADTKVTRSSPETGRLTVLAGGTDFYPAQTARAAWLQASPKNMNRHFTKDIQAALEKCKSKLQ